MYHHSFIVEWNVKLVGLDLIDYKVNKVIYYHLKRAGNQSVRQMNKKYDVGKAA